MKKQAEKKQKLTHWKNAIGDGADKEFINLPMSTKDLLCFYLYQLSSGAAKDENEINFKSAASSALFDINRNIYSIEISEDKKGRPQITWEPNRTGETEIEKDPLLKDILTKTLHSDPVTIVIKRLFDELKKRTPKGKFRRSAHLTDQILKYNYPKDRQPSLFDSLESETIKQRVESARVEKSQIVEYIKLSPSETKIIDCLCKLLHETSQTSNAKGEDYYSGNIGYNLIKYGGEDTQAPKLAFTLYELTKEYKGGEYVSGRDIENVKQILTELSNKRFLLSYVEKTTKKDGGRIEKKIEEFQQIIGIIKMSETEFSKENIELSKKEETVILLNPIFRRQIDSKFILYPNDINRRTIIAYGSHNLSDATLRLRDELIRALSGKHYTYEIRLERLYYLLAEKWMKESRRTLVKKYTDKALETVKALGILTSYEIKPASTGEPKVVFSLNKDWE
jgi:hypothetical protein